MKRNLFTILMFLAASFTAIRAHAADPTDVGNITLPWSSSITTTSGLLDRIGNWFIAILGPLAVVAVVYSGIMYIMSQSTDQSANAKKNLTWAIIGIVAVVVSFVVIKEVASIFE